MQAIQTKYYPPTNKRGARIKASCKALTVTFKTDSCDKSKHIAAAEELCSRIAYEAYCNYNETNSPWLKPFATGQLKDGTFVHVFI